MSPDQQLQRWVDGKPECPNDHGECCPDFSCCDPSLLAPKEERLRFARGDQNTREKMCMGFLGRFAATVDADVYLAGERQ